MDMLATWLSPDGFMPHGHCYLWTPTLLWMYVVSDSLICLSYYTIPLALLYFVRKRTDIQFNWIFIMFSIFIFACGTTHLISILTIWKPAYWLDASAKVITATVSGITAMLLWRLMPTALQLPSTQQLQDAVTKLKREVKDRRTAETALAFLNETLESRVAERTAELTAANRLLLEEIQTRKQAEQAVFDEKQRALVTLESIGDAVITTNTQSQVVYLNPVAEKMTGWTNNDAAGRPLMEVFRIVNESSRKPAPDAVELVLAYGDVCGLTNHHLLIGRHGTEYSIEDSAAPIRDRNGTLFGVVLVFHDVSSAKKMANTMTYLAQHDLLTDLPNRLLLVDRLTQALTSAKRRNSGVALMFLDIDRFKNINDTLGHEMGDQLLKMLSKSLQSCLRSSDTISRQGGDEFLILLPDIADFDNCARIAEKLIAAAASNYVIDTHELTISISIGIAVFPEDGTNAEALIKNADTAMYHAKNMGRNNYQFFTNEMTQRVSEQVTLENHLRKAITNNEFVLFYQPKVSIATGKIVGAEALIRWQHPDWGLVAPDRFIPVAEDSGLIKPIGSWVLHEACSQIKAWQDMGLPAISVAINTSVVQLRQADFLQEVTQVLMQSGVAPHYLELEVTESIAIQGETEVIDWLHTLKEMGVGLSLDDFGTGYSSLAYLKRLPFDTIKIDRSFIRDIGADQNDTAIITAIISMSHSLHLKVIAEGVETIEQLEFLRVHDCDQIQGYLFSRPVPAERFAELLIQDQALPYQIS